MDHSHGWPGRQREWVCTSRGRNEILPIADARLADTLGETVVPEETSHYAVTDWDPRAAVHGLCQAYLAARSPRSQQRSRAFWQSVQAGAGVSIDQDILAHLGRWLVIHDYPPHALRLPFAWTILVQIDGDASALRRSIDRLLAYTRRELRVANTHSKVGNAHPTGPGIVQLRRDMDGVWYIFAGINGPALAVTDRWLVISFSPTAVRQNVALLSRSE